MRHIIGACAVFALLEGCGLSLVVLESADTETAIEQAQRGGKKWGCHEQRSELFRVYLVCPTRELTIGVADGPNRLEFACPDHKPRTCKKLGRELLRAGGATSAEVDP